MADRKSYKVDMESLCSTGDFSIRFYLNAVDLMREEWRLNNSHRIADAVRFQSFENLQKIAAIIGYENIHP